MPSSISSLFDSLPPRPPTPPKETSQAIEDAISFLDDSNEIERLTTATKAEQTLSLEAEASPSSSQDISVISNATKRVGFSPHPVCHKISLPDQSSSPAAQLLKRMPLIKNSKPLKSILKPSNVPPPPTPEDLESKFSYFSPEIPGSFAKMLQSVLHQLAGPSRASRLDAYLTLNGVLKAYRIVPDAPAMAQKMPLIMQFLSRDIAWKNADGNLDTNIITQALTLTLAILFDLRLVEGFDDDFRIFLIDRSIAMMEQADIPKGIIKTHAYLLGQQRFRASLMTAARAEKIITALQTVDDRCSGNSIIGTRLVIYVRLLDQAPAVMLTRIRDWLEHVFHGMLSDIAEIRNRAIETCTRAGLVLGQQAHAGACLHEMFRTEVEDGQTYCDYLQFRLIKMLNEKEMRVSVPQIWSAVILFFRSKKQSLANWPQFKSWIQLVQRCLNASDIDTRHQAIIAWNKLVFVVMPNSAIPKGVMSMLRIPIISGLDKRGSDKHFQKAREHALDCYCNLLHYSFRPGLSNDEHDAAWELYVDNIVSRMTKANGKSRDMACKVLHGLINGSKGVWNGNAAIEQTPIKPEELPKLDPKWIRSRLRNFLVLLEPVISASMWSSPEANAILDETWNSLLQSVADAGTQEVKTSGDLKEALAQLVNVFRRLWTGYSQPPIEIDEGRWLNRYVFLIESAATILGSSPFCEDFLSKTQDDGIEVAPTPSHRHSKYHSSPQSPLLILFVQFYYPSSALVIDETYRPSVSGLLERLISCKAGPPARLELLSRTFQQSLQLHPQDVDSFTKEQIWLAVAESVISCLEVEDCTANGQGSQSLGYAIRHALDILLMGVGQDTSASCLDEFERLYNAVCCAAKAGAGDGGIATAVMEPFAKALMETASSITMETRIRLTNHVLQKTVWPRNQQSIDEARKALWGVGLAPHKANIFDPFDSVYRLIVNVMIEAYKNLDGNGISDLDGSLAVLSSTTTFLGKSPPSLLVTALRKIQDGFAEWIADSTRKTGTPEKLSKTIQNTWSIIIHHLKSVSITDTALLKAFEPLLAAGFASPHRCIVNETILFWNESFGNETSLEYPTKLQTILRARVVDADIMLPTFPDSPNDHVPASLPQFFEPQSQQAPIPSLPKGLNNMAYSAGGFALTQSSYSPYLTAKRSPAHLTSLSSPIHRHSRQSASSTPKPRLRHDNSQIDFASINSSPIRPTDYSQALTEHQKEVTMRQHENAQIFPDFSSSPMAHSTALPKAKRLDFSSNASRLDEDVQPGTPSALADGQGLMSDELPSSPTPSSGKATDQRATAVGYDETIGETAQDPPSSPPRAPGYENERAAQQYDVGPDETTVDITDFAVTDIKRQQPESDGLDDVAPTLGTNELNSDYPSDSQLPTMQLHLEERAAQVQLEIPSKPSARIVNAARRPSQESQSRGAGQTKEDEMAVSKPKVSSQEDIEGIARVKDSFAYFETGNDLQSPTGSQDSQRASKKRKRANPAVYSAKKRNQQSPLKSFTSLIFGQSQEVDEDIGEDIVVASSQRSPATVRNVGPPGPSPPSNLNDSLPQSVEQSEFSTKLEKEQEPATMSPPMKRGPGRPRKSETPTPNLNESAPTKSPKRKASTLSNVDTSGTPAPRKSIRQSNSRVSSSQPSQDDLEPGRKARTAWAVVIDSTAPGAVNDKPQHYADDDHESEDMGSIEVATPNKQLVDDQTAATDMRPIATPRSILKRLRDALGDLRGMFLGSQEEREMDDVLYELRKETHEAARRGRGQ